MRRAHLFLAGLALVLTGCDDKCPGGSKCTLQAAGDDAGALPACIVGAWRSAGDGGSCAPFPCRPDAGPPECAQADCVQREVVVFVPDSQGSSSGAMYSASFIASSTRGTWSNPIKPEQFVFGVNAAQLITDAGAGPRAQSVTCTVQQLVLGEIALKTRSPAPESAALRALMLDGGTWSGLPLP